MSYRRRKTHDANLSDAFSKTETPTAVRSIRFVRQFTQPLASDGCGPLGAHGLGIQNG
jgi:hypothetical protein